MFRTRTILAAAGAATAIAALSACNRDNKSGSTHTMSGSTSGSSRTYGTTESSGAGHEVSSATAFLQQAAMGGRAEVELSQIALRQSSRQDIRDLAQQMIADHTAVNQQVQQMAETRSITLPSQPDTQHRQIADRLTSTSGESFDQQYLQQMLQDHQQTIAVFEREAQNASDPQIRTFAANTLPALRHHLQMVQTVMSGQGMGGMQHDMNHMKNMQPSGAQPANQQPASGQPSSTPSSTDNPSTNPR